MLDVREYLALDGYSTFRAWFDDLDAAAAARVTTALVRIGHGNLSNDKAVGEGVLEYRLDFGPGYRIYFGRDGEALVSGSSVILRQPVRAGQTTSVARRK